MFHVEMPDLNSAGFLAAIETYARHLRAIYSARANWHRRLYRLSGILVILVGSGLPMLISLDYAGKTAIVSTAGMLVAVATGLRSFYRWDQSWVLLRSTEMAITEALLDWHTRKGTLGADDDTPAEEQREIARQFAQKLTDIRMNEARSYFKDMWFPVQESGAQTATQLTQPR
jgi:hypothetical protein